MRVEAAGLCHTDIHAAHGDWPVKPKLPLIPGHEGVGIVTALGPGVTGVAEGDRFVGHVPNGMDPFEAAPLTCAGVTTYKAVRVAQARPSDLVAVYGIGGLGHLTLQYAKIAGATVVAVDLVDDKLSLGGGAGGRPCH